MRYFIDRYPRTIERFFEILIPLSAWLFITMPFWLSFWHPAIVAYFIITFDIYWFYKSFTLGVSAIKSYLTMQAHTKVDWLTKAKSLPQFKKIMHIVVIPEYCEPIHILRRTLDNLVHADIPKDKLIIILATEAKDPNALETGALLSKEYKNLFGGFFVTRHPLVAGEVAGKSSNMAYAAKQITPILKKRGVDPEWATITSCDADALLHPKYFSYLSHSFITDPLRDYHFYQGAILFYNNIWRIPLPNRIFNTFGSIWNLSVLSQPNRFIIFSSYSFSLHTAESVDFWDVDIIPEDYHMYFKVYFSKGEQVRARGIFLPVLVDAAESHGFIKTILNQYEQSKRWAWGVSDIPFIIRNAMIHTEIPFSDRFKRIILILEQHIFWPTNWFLLTLGSTIPPLVNPEFGRTLLGHNLAQLSSGILTLSAIFLIIVFIIDWRIKPPRPKDYAAWKLPFLYLQWFAFPLISLVLSALPGLDAHTRLMLGKRLEYRVTEKV